MQEVGVPYDLTGKTEAGAFLRCRLCMGLRLESDEVAIEAHRPVEVGAVDVDMRDGEEVECHSEWSALSSCCLLGSPAFHDG